MHLSIQRERGRAFTEPPALKSSTFPVCHRVWESFVGDLQAGLSGNLLSTSSVAEDQAAPIQHPIQPFYSPSARNWTLNRLLPCQGDRNPHPRKKAQSTTSRGLASVLLMLALHAALHRSYVVARRFLDPTPTSLKVLLSELRRTWQIATCEPSLAKHGGVVSVFMAPAWLGILHFFRPLTDTKCGTALLILEVTTATNLSTACGPETG